MRDCLIQPFIKIFRALLYSFDGLKFALSERAFKQEFFIFLILLPVAIKSNTDNTSKILLISSLLMVLIIELINSAIETAIDKISTERNLLSKKAKDLGSAAVFLAILNAFFVWAFIML